MPVVDIHYDWDARPAVQLSDGSHWAITRYGGSWKRLNRESSFDVDHTARGLLPEEFAERFPGADVSEIPDLSVVDSGDLPIVTANELSNQTHYYGELLSVEISAIEGGRGALLLEFRAGGNGFAQSRHMVMTDTRQALKLSAQIRRRLLPEFERRVLTALDRIEKK